MPFVSAVMPALNSTKHILPCLRSIGRQASAGFEALGAGAPARAMIHRP